MIITGLGRVLCGVLIVSLAACATPRLQNELIDHAAQEDTARKNLDASFKEICSSGKELWEVKPAAMSKAIRCGDDVFLREFLPSVRYKDLAVSLKDYLFKQSVAFSKRTISKRVFKSRVITAWNTYNAEWIKRSQAELQQSAVDDETAQNVAAGAVAVLAIVALIAVAASGGGGGGANSFTNPYDGNCPCPGDTAADGSRCGTRSAYSRSGGATPFCPISRL